MGQALVLSKTMHDDEHLLRACTEGMRRGLVLALGIRIQLVAGDWAALLGAQGVDGSMT